MYLKTDQQSKITKDTLILLMGLFYPAIHNYIWRVLVGFTEIFGLYFSIQLFDSVVWTTIIGHIVMTTRPVTIKVKTLMLYLIFVLVTLLSFAFTSYESFSLSVLFTLLIGTFSFFIQGSLINLKRVSREQLYVSAVVTLIISIAYTIYFINSKDITLSDNMDLAYNILPSVLVIVSEVFTEKKKKFTIVFSVIGAVFLLLQGTRGPLLVLAVFVCLMLYKKYGLGKFFFKIGTVVLLFSILVSSQFVKLQLVELSDKVDSSGYSSRFITMLLEGEISNSNGRDTIQKALLEDIKENPFAIRGMFADRQATRGLVDHEYSMRYKKGTYAHNFWLETIHSWGVLLGGAIFLIVLFIILKIVRISDKEDAYIVMLFVCTGFVYLFFSGSYLQSEKFFFLIGLALNYRNYEEMNILTK